jgi:RHS repeat-associated protein
VPYCRSAREESFYFITDGIGSCRLVVDEDGEVVASYDADEFGNPTVVSESGVSTPARWVGGLGYKDEVAATGLYYLRQRYYAPDLGRWISRDPIGFAGGLNLFAYVRNSPVNMVDPLGLKNEVQINGGGDAFLAYLTKISGIPVKFNDAGTSVIRDTSRKDTGSGWCSESRSLVERFLNPNEKTTTRIAVYSGIDVVSPGAPVEDMVAAGAGYFHAIDMMDIGQFSAKNQNVGLGQFSHELFEAEHEFKNFKGPFDGVAVPDYNAAHQAATQFEAGCGGKTGLQRIGGGTTTWNKRPALYINYKNSQGAKFQFQWVPLSSGGADVRMFPIK